MQAIEAKYKGPTYSKGSRIIVNNCNERKTYSYYEMQTHCENFGMSNNHENTIKLAMATFLLEIGWLTALHNFDERYAVGQCKNGNWVAVSR